MLNCTEYTNNSISGMPFTCMLIREHKLEMSGSAKGTHASEFPFNARERRRKFEESQCLNFFCLDLSLCREDG